MDRIIGSSFMTLVRGSTETFERISAPREARGTRKQSSRFKCVAQESRSVRGEFES